jgi:hypothetical protein
MVSPIGNVVSNQLEAQVAAPAASRSSPPEAAKQAAAPTDTVRLSSTANAVLQESTETPAQTTKEANAGDVQARRLLAKLAHH